MPIYKVLKDFPSKNGAREYTTGKLIELQDNSRTKALVNMGYVQWMASQMIDCSGRDLLTEVSVAVAKIKGIKHVHVSSLGVGVKTRSFAVDVEEE